MYHQGMIINSLLMLKLESSKLLFCIILGVYGVKYTNVQYPILSIKGHEYFMWYNSYNMRIGKNLKFDEGIPALQC